jgi:uncharacterized protein with ATP-grasp and redox domains
MVKQETGIEDLYAEEKRQSNEGALAVAPKIRKALQAAEDPLFTALEYAIAGNSIDFGARHDLDIMQTIESLVEDEAELIKNERPELFAYSALRRSLEAANGRSGTLLYIADNAGELVFDGILAETIGRQFPHLSITIAVREEPILNDATLQDAAAAGIPGCLRVISSGSTAPGTLLEECSDRFREEFDRADTIISKGQGNYETLSEEEREIFFLLKIKCGVIAADTGGHAGDILLMRNGGRS